MILSKLAYAINLILICGVFICISYKLTLNVHYRSVLTESQILSPILSLALMITYAALGPKVYTWYHTSIYTLLADTIFDWLFMIALTGISIGWTWARISIKRK